MKKHKIEIGKYYQGYNSKVIVKALGNEIGDDFRGIVVVKNDNSNDVGHIDERWSVSRFTEIDYKEETSNELFPIY